jgi:hypothetical protein
MTLLVYIAGPYRAPTTWEIQKNIHNARLWGVIVAKAGAYPMIPHSNTAHFDGAVEGDAFWLNGTLEMMRRCDGVVLIEGWDRSTGAIEERRQAEQLGIPCLEVDWWSNRGGSAIHDDVSDWIKTLKPRSTHAV